MALFDEGPQTLEDILGKRAESQTMDITNQFAKKRKASVAQQAHAGRLGSGVSNYQAGDLASEEIGALGDVESGLAETLGGIPTEDYLSSQENERNLSLAHLIGSLKKKSSLMNALGGAGSLGGLAATLGAGPVGVGLAAAGGGILGGYG